MALCEKECAAFFSQCLSYMDIREVLQKRKMDPKFLECTELGRKNFSAGQRAAAIPERVTDSSDIGVASVYRATGLNAEEYEHVITRRPLKKDTRYLPTCMAKGLNKSGEIVDELVYLFSWDAQSIYRTIEFRLAHSVTREKTIMAAEQISFG